MAVTANRNISFTYESLEGEVKAVESLSVDRVFTSKAGDRIVQGWLTATDEGRSYREDRMTNVKEV